MAQYINLDAMQWLSSRLPCWTWTQLYRLVTFPL